MEGEKYFFEMFDGLPRAGPGDDECTRRAFTAMEGLPPKPRILDVGCGPGKQTLELARVSGGHVTAIDVFQPHLDRLVADAGEQGLAGRVEAVNMSMTDISYGDGSFDVVWSEGALYIMGFQRGLRECARLVRPGGCIGATEAVLLRPDLPDEVRRMWQEEYPAIMDVEGNLRLVARVGLRLLDHFTLPETAWSDNYYAHMAVKVEAMKAKHAGNGTALEVLRKAEEEMRLYREYSDFYGYEFFVARKP